jgi:hypothetical protein
VVSSVETTPKFCFGDNSTKITIRNRWTDDFDRLWTGDSQSLDAERESQEGVGGQAIYVREMKNY